ncbi:hypothetical protein NM688_g8798 [Phlebia brevispora]|uniref:Uncharacterized protein n=1 Tax=Phlebia brevispora TaxID=194682 RepID=A0ACC1RPL1_9APHY|nr:hypothetical protein NM688_g8798 [Phlebia brevispora]
MSIWPFFFGAKRVEDEVRSLEGVAENSMSGPVQADVADRPESIPGGFTSGNEDLEPFHLTSSGSQPVSIFESADPAFARHGICSTTKLDTAVQPVHASSNLIGNYADRTLSGARPSIPSEHSHILRNGYAMTKGGTNMASGYDVIEHDSASLDQSVDHRGVSSSSWPSWHDPGVSPGNRSLVPGLEKHDVIAPSSPTSPRHSPDSHPQSQRGFNSKKDASATNLSSVSLRGLPPRSSDYIVWPTHYPEEGSETMPDAWELSPLEESEISFCVPHDESGQTMQEAREGNSLDVNEVSFRSLRVEDSDKGAGDDGPNKQEHASAAAEDDSEDNCMTHLMNGQTEVLFLSPRGDDRDGDTEGGGSNQGEAASVFEQEGWEDEPVGAALADGETEVVSFMSPRSDDNTEDGGSGQEPDAGAFEQDDWEDEAMGAALADGETKVISFMSPRDSYDRDTDQGGSGQEEDARGSEQDDWEDENELVEGETEVDRILAQLAEESGADPATKADLQNLVVVMLDANDKLYNAMNRAQRDPDLEQRQPPEHKGIRRHVQHRILGTVKNQARLRFFVMEAMGRDELNSEIVVPLDQDVRLFDKGRHPGPTLPNIQLYLGQELACRWNKKAIDILAEAFIASGVSDCENLALVKKMLQTHLHTLQNQYKKQSRNGELTQADREMQSQVNRGQRRRGVHERRFEAHYKHRDLCTEELDDLWKLLDYTAHSGDESEVRSDGETYFIRTRLRWRSEEFRDFLRSHDYVYLSTRFHPDGKATRGKFPRHRIVGSRRIEKFDPPVAGLPANCYDEDWLATLEPKTREELNLLPPIDLTLSDAIQECVFPFVFV